MTQADLALKTLRLRFAVDSRIKALLRMRDDLDGQLTGLMDRGELTSISTHDGLRARFVKPREPKCQGCAAKWRATYSTTARELRFDHVKEAAA